MCGIAGFYPLHQNYNSQEAQEIAKAMGACLHHRGPDSGDIWQHTDTGLTFIHRRLAIIDLSIDGAQPMRSASGQYMVTFNGEIYNYRELRTELEGQGAQFRGASDTEVMLAGFDVWGFEKTLHKLNGMFAFALYDFKENTLLFVRDRFGKKPLYIGWAGKSLVFSSELKAFHHHPEFQKRINTDVLAQYMKYGYVHAPYCIFNGVSQLLPASFLSIDLSSLTADENLAEKMKYYWSLKEVTQNGLDNQITKPASVVIDEFEDLLERAVAERMISDVPLGAFLSGGIDSSSVVALMQKQSSTPVKTFSVGFNQEGFNEAEYAKQIAGHLGTDHHEFYVTDQDALNVIPQLPQIYDEPFADQSQIPTYLISKLARDHVTVVLTGDGGDEILGGYDRHTKIPPLWNKVGFLPHMLRKVLCDVLGLLPTELYSALKKNNPHFGAQVKRALGLMGLKDTNAIYDALVSGWQGGENTVLDSHLPLTLLQDKSQWPNNLSFLDEMIFGDLLSYRTNDLMVKTDRASMAVALEARAPLMDYQLAEYAWRLPADMKVQGGQGKWLLRQILKKHIPENLYERPKMGFSIPLNQWLQGPLKEWANELLAPEKIKNQGLFDVDLIRDTWNNFQICDGAQSSRKDLWTILMFQSWYKEWME